MCLQPFDRRVERHREEDGDEDPDQDAASDLDDLDQDDGGEDDPEHADDRTRPEADEALLHRGDDTPGIGWFEPRRTGAAAR